MHFPKVAFPFFTRTLALNLPWGCESCDPGWGSRHNCAGALLFSGWRYNIENGHLRVLKFSLVTFHDMRRGFCEWRGSVTAISPRCYRLSISCLKACAGPRVWRPTAGLAPPPSSPALVLVADRAARVAIGHRHRTTRASCKI